MRGILASIALGLAAFVAAVPAAAEVTPRLRPLLNFHHLMLWGPQSAGTTSCRNNVYLPVWREQTVPCVLTLDAYVGVEKRARPITADYQVPPLLSYSQSADGSRADFAVSLTPGGPCTGACIRLAGSF